MIKFNYPFQLLVLFFMAAATPGLAQPGGQAPGDADSAHDHVTPEHPASSLERAPTVEQASPAGPHGGVIVEEGGLRAEIVVAATGVKLYLLHSGQVETSGLHIAAVLKVDDALDQRRFELLPQPANADGVRSYEARYDLSRHGGKTAQLTIEGHVRGSSARPFPKLVASVQLPRSAEESRAAAIAEQKVCPVTGGELGSMGEPIPVTVDGETIYVCCDGCVSKVKADFTGYLRKLRKAPELTASPATEADSDAIAQQGTCPVMDEPLGSMGTPIKVTGLGRDVFLCCKGCLKFLRDDPQKYLAKLPPLPAPAVTKAGKADAAQVEVQKLCPVMDEPLDAMGGPYRTVVEGRVVYLCCPGCAKLLHANPAEYFEKLAAQGVEPPMER